MKEEVDARCAFLVALNKVQGTIEAVTKDSTNPHFKSKYASLSAVNQTVMGPLAEAGFVVMAGGVDVGGKPYLRTTLSHIKGHSESFDYPIVNDANPQHIASSVTYARRYAICALLNLSVEDDDGETTVGRGNFTAKTISAPTAKVSAAVEAVFKPQPITEGESIAFIPAAVSIKEGEGAKGPWKKYGVCSPDKMWFGTFTEEIGQAALKAKEDKALFAFTYKSDGKFNTITGLRVEAAVPF